MKLLTKIQAAALLCAASCPAFADGVDYQTISDAASKTGDVCIDRCETAITHNDFESWFF